MKKIYFFIVFVLILSSIGKSQNSVLDLFRTRLKTADLLFKKRDFPNAIENYKSVLGRGKDSTYILLQLARAYYNLNLKNESGIWYARVRTVNFYSNEDMLNVAEIYLAAKNKEEAQYWFSEYQKSNPADSRIQQKLEALKTAPSFFIDSLSYHVENMPFNSEESDFYPYILDKKILFLSSRPNFSLLHNYTAMDESRFLEIYETTGESSNAVAYKPLNTPYHEGPFCFLEDGNRIIITRSEKKNKNLLLLMADKKGNNWVNLTPLPFNNQSYSVSHPFFSTFDSCLYFASDMPGGYGGTDIYRSRLRNGKFDSPENLGPYVNTEGNEMFPFMQDQKLYFSSNGHGGLGGLDIFYVSSYGNQWINLSNPGFPVNSTADDFSIFFSDPYQGYFSSNRSGGKGKDDIYHFKEIRQELSIDKIEEFNHQKISKVHLSIVEADKMILKDSTIASYPFKLSLKPGKKYHLIFSKDGYKQADTTIFTEDNPTQPLSLSCSLERKIKAYIKGIVYSPEGVKVPKAKIKIINTATGIIDTTTTDDSGEFVGQVDCEYKYILAAEKDSIAGIQPIQPIGHRRGSSVTTIEINCFPCWKKDVKIQVINPATKIHVSYSEVQLENIDTGEKIYLNTDVDGSCSVKINSCFKYRATPFCNNSWGTPFVISPQPQIILNFNNL